MDEKSLINLEFNKITEKLAELAVSAPAKAEAEALLPVCDLYEINRRQNETTDAVSCMTRYGRLPLGGFSDVSAAAKRAEYGGILSIYELLKVGDMLRACAKVKKYGQFEGRGEPYETLAPYFESVIELRELTSEIERCVLSETEISDDASPTLRSVRREIKVCNDRIKDSLNKIIHSSTYKTMLQDAVITVRGGRYCVPVKQEYKNQFGGMVHDQSSTGATYFIEPLSVVNLNNSIKECEAKEKIEIEKILLSLSGMVAENAEIINANTEAVTALDFIFARASLSLSMNASRPVFNTEGRVDIKKGRHPLLNRETVVPTDIRLGKDFTTLLITGPNTGGKTVALKTIGLLTIMGQAGLHIPAFDNSELAVFDNVFSDIGDEQSIEQNLSTFSGHMKNIVRILAAITDNSLALFDELGAGTDPTEGAALAMSIIESLHERGIRTVITTHYAELKVYAITREGMENASCEFDVETLTPTYKLLIGIPGKSNAFAISKRLGMSDGIIDAAKEFISRENVRFEDVITELEITRKSVELEQERAAQYKQEAQRLHREVEEQKEKMRIQREKILAKAKSDAYEITQKANAEADAIIKEMKKVLTESSEKSKVEAERKKLREMLSDSYEDAHATRKKGTRPENLKEGDRVFIISFQQPGTALSVPDKNGRVKVTCGGMKIEVNIDDLETDDNVYAETEPKISYGKGVKAGKSANIASEIDLRGQTMEEALENTTKYIDDAYLSGLKTVSIIHGKGTGVLREAIRKMLSKNQHVANWRAGTYGEGDAGVTIAELK